jgi:hypothetical protein
MRRLVFHDKPPVGMGCSVCAWRFVIPVRLPEGEVNQLIQQLKDQCDEEFRKHVCAPSDRGSNPEVAHDEPGNRAHVPQAQKPSTADGVGLDPETSSGSGGVVSGTGSKLTKPTLAEGTAERRRK